MKRPAFVLCVLAVAALLGDLAAAQDPRQTSRPGSRPTSGPARAGGRGPDAPATATAAAAAAAAATAATGDREALALARRVHDYAGGAGGLRQVENIAFTFTVRGSHRRQFWDLAAAKVRVEFPDPKEGALGVPIHVLVFDIRKDENILRHPPRPHPNAPQVSAKSTWVNDSYWLLVPLKVLDPGVQLSIDPRAEDDPAGVARLRLRFQGGTGLTPRNEYVLHVEQDTGRVTRWDFYRTAKALPLSWKFQGYGRIGNLRLSLDRPPIGERNRNHVKLLDVQVNAKVPPEVWTSTERLFLR